MTVEIICGDCRDVLSTLPDESFQTVVTSPPYWSLRDYGVDGIGLESSLDEYVENLVGVFREVRRVLRPDGTLWLNLGDAYAGSWGNYHPTGKGGQRAKSTTRWNRRGYADRDRLPPAANAKGQGLKRKDLMMMPARVAMALQADGVPDGAALRALERAMDALVDAYDGDLPDRVRAALERLEEEYRDAKGESWWLRSEIVWSKPNPMPESVLDRPTCANERIYLFAKQERYFYDAEPVRTPAKNPEDDLRRIKQAKSAHKSSSDSRHKGLRPREKQRGHTRKHEGWLDKGTKADQQAGGANLRNVWTVATRPFPDAHFATFPPDLVDPCIKAGTSEQGACAECGAPLRRMLSAKVRGEGRGSGNKERKHQGERGVPVGGANDHRGCSIPWTPTTRKTVGWDPTCNCRADTVPCRVLDPFSGAGTVGLVARQLGRDSVLIEMNPEYAEMSRDRIKSDLPILDDVVLDFREAAR